MNRNDRAIVALVMLAHGMVHTYELSIPIFITIWLNQYEVIDLGIAQFPVTQATLGAVVTGGYALFGLGALPGGIVVDRVGSRRLITACLVGMAGSFLLLWLSPSLAVVAVGLLLWGAAASVYHPAGLALLSKGVDARGTGFAYHGIAGNVGIGLGPLLTALLLLVFDWTTVAGILAIPAFVAAVYATRAEFDESAAVAADGGDESTDSKASTGVSSFSELLVESRRLFTGQFALVFTVAMCSGLYYRGVLTFLPGLLADLPGFAPVAISSLLPASLDGLVGGGSGSQTLQPENYVYSGILMVGVLGQYVGGRLTDRIAIEHGIAGAFGCLALLAVAFLPVANAGFGPLLFVGAVLGFALFVVQPLYQAAIAEYTPAGTRGLSYGFTYLGVFGVGALGGVIAGTILSYASPPVLFLTLAVIAGTASLIGVLLSRKKRTTA